MNLLETVDLMLLRGILEAPKSTPKEMLFLELGCLPFSEIVRQRRLAFLHYILHERPESMVFKFFQTQYRNRTSKDWVTTILKDLEEINLGMTIEEIQTMKKSKYMKLLKKCIQDKALMELQKRKENHSKVAHLQHFGIQMQKYLLPNDQKMKVEEMQLIFKIRCRVTEVKTNMKGSYESYECDLCRHDEETQEHILNCTKIVNMNRTGPKCLDPIFNGRVRDKIKIARQFNENIKIRNKLLNETKVK